MELCAAYIETCVWLYPWLWCEGRRMYFTTPNSVPPYVGMNYFSFNGNYKWDGKQWAFVPDYFYDREGASWS